MTADLDFSKLTNDSFGNRGNTYDPSAYRYSAGGPTDFSNPNAGGNNLDPVAQASMAIQNSGRNSNTQVVGSAPNSSEYYQPFQPRTFSAAPPIFAPPPNSPNLQRLQRLYGRVGSTVDPTSGIYNNAINDTRNSGFAAAETAGRAYASRQLQQGINPSSSGLVAAQARMPVFSAVNALSKEKAESASDWQTKQFSMQSQIAQGIAAIQSSYAKTVADYNQAQSAYSLDLNKFNAQQALEASKYEEERRRYLQQQQLLASQMASSGTARTSSRPTIQMQENFNPGYIPTFGPIRAGSGFTGANGNNVALAW